MNKLQGRNPLAGHFDSVAAFYQAAVPTYDSVVYKPLVVTMGWSTAFSPQIWRINEARAAKRIASYVDAGEILRVHMKLANKDGASIRFGVSKGGRGYHGERGDFCLVGGYIERSGSKGLAHLHLFYRSLELIGGFGYDICLIDHVAKELNLGWKTVSVMAVSANVFALKRNSNEKLYPKLKGILS